MDKQKELADQIAHDGITGPHSEIAYNALFESLAKEPEESLDVTFAQRVMARLERIEKKNRIWYFGLMFGGAAMALGLSIGMIFYIYGKETLPMFDGVINWAVLVGALIVMIQYLDSRLVHKKSPILT